MLLLVTEMINLIYWLTNRKEEKFNQKTNQ
jgi:hypothetical protein